VGFSRIITNFVENYWVFANDDINKISYFFDVEELASTTCYRRLFESRCCRQLGLVFNGKVIYNMLYGYYKRYIMSKEESTTIQLKKSIVKELKNIRRYPRETYNETISNLIKQAEESKTRRQYDEFLHKIQQSKMKELWDNTDDEAWEHA
jgi:hypothetical protein